MNCPKCESKKLKPISVHTQNRKFRCEECGWVVSIGHYEFAYELFHEGICGRCKQSIQGDE